MVINGTDQYYSERAIEARARRARGENVVSDPDETQEVNYKPSHKLRAFGEVVGIGLLALIPLGIFGLKVDADRLERKQQEIYAEIGNLLEQPLQERDMKRFGELNSADKPGFGMYNPLYIIRHDKKIRLEHYSFLPKKKDISNE